MWSLFAITSISYLSLSNYLLPHLSKLGLNALEFDDFFDVGIVRVAVALRKISCGCTGFTVRSTVHSLGRKMRKALYLCVVSASYRIKN